MDSHKRNRSYQTCASGRSSAHLQTARPDSWYWYPQPLSNPPYLHSADKVQNIPQDSPYLPKTSRPHFPLAARPPQSPQGYHRLHSAWQSQCDYG